jgi:surfactin synthase thioesterase subunit
MVVSLVLPPTVIVLPNRLLLFCLPYVGASASVCRDWVLIAPEFLQVCPIELAGRGQLTSARFAESPSASARMISEEISAHVDRPYAIFGHSVGALLTYEVVSQLESVGQPQPLKIFLSGALPPFLVRDKRMARICPMCRLGAT